MAYKILVVDDEMDLLDILSFNLEKNNFLVTAVRSGEEALAEIDANNDFSLILLDVMMGGISGFEVAERLRKARNEVPIIFLTALDTENDLLKGFKLGADDYIAKPFSVKEVLVRVQAVLARAPQKPKVLFLGNILLDLDRKEVQVGGEVIVLTKTEFSLLSLLLKYPTRFFSRDELISKVWGQDVYVELRTVDVHMTRLRKKIEKSDLAIVSRSGYGYCIEEV